MYNPLISVIVPVYKVEKHIVKCVESILNQSYRNIELLLIDDGSPDKSGMICDDFASSDCRVRTFHKKNGGVSSARNFGLDMANGDLVFFCDSDDWIDTNTFEAYIHSEIYDIVQLPRNAGSNFKNYKEDICCTKKSKLSRFLSDNFTCEIWGKIYKRNIIGKTRFPLNISIGEDIIFLLEIYRNINNYCIVSSVGMYHYNDANSNSLMTTQVKLDSNELMIRELLALQQAHWTLTYYFVTSYYWKLCLKNDNLLFLFWKSIPLFRISYFSLPIKCFVKIHILCLCGTLKSIILQWKLIC